jgi:medium-chain acyl-[acyl-carrier-protein] hydrolase
MTTRIDPRAFHIPVPNPAAAVVVYGIAHAGAGAAPWNAVAEHVPATIEVRGIRLPGREKRLRQPGHETVAAAAGEVAAVLAEDAATHGKPILVAGSCSGALLARVALGEVATGVTVVGLVASRQPPPGEPPWEDDVRVAEMSSDDLRAWLRCNRLTPATLLDDDRLFGFFEPVLRIDLAMTEGYVHHGPPLSCAIILLQAAGSPLRARVVSGWRAETTGPMHVLDVRGDGDILTAHPERFAAALADAICLVGEQVHSG